MKYSVSIILKLIFLNLFTIIFIFYRDVNGTLKGNNPNGLFVASRDFFGIVGGVAYIFPGKLAARHYTYVIRI